MCKKMLRLKSRSRWARAGWESKLDASQEATRKRFAWPECPAAPGIPAFTLSDRAAANGLASRQRVCGSAARAESIPSCRAKREAARTRMCRRWHRTATKRSRGDVRIQSRVQSSWRTSRCLSVHHVFGRAHRTPSLANRLLPEVLPPRWGGSELALLPGDSCTGRCIDISMQSTRQQCCGCIGMHRNLIHFEFRLPPDPTSLCGLPPSVSTKLAAHA